MSSVSTMFSPLPMTVKAAVVPVEEEEEEEEGEEGMERKKVMSRRQMFVISSSDTLAEPETNGISVSGMSEHGHAPALETISLESSVCSSPDSGVQDDLVNSAPRHLGGRTFGTGMPHISLHTQSSPSVLRDKAS